MATTEYWFNEKEQKLFEKRARGSERTPGDTDREGNVFIWNMDPRNRYTIKSEWLSTLLSLSPVKPVTADVILKWAGEVSATADECLPKGDFEINREHYNPIPLLILINRYSSLGGESEKYMLCSWSVDTGDGGLKKMGRVPSKSDAPDKLWINMYHDGYGAFHSEPLEAFKKGYPDVDVTPGAFWHGWIIQGVATSPIDAAIGHMLESIATTTASNPAPATTVSWFQKIKDLITRCFNL